MIKVSKVITILFVVLIFVHLSEGVLVRINPKIRLPYRHMLIVFPFTDNFYFRDISAFLVDAKSSKKIDLATIIQDQSSFFVARMYWAIHSRFYLLSESHFQGISQKICKISTNQKSVKLIFVTDKGLESEKKRTYDCKN